MQTQSRIPIIKSFFSFVEFLSNRYFTNHTGFQSTYATKQLKIETIHIPFTVFQPLCSCFHKWSPVKQSMYAQLQLLCASMQSIHTTLQSLCSVFQTTNAHSQSLSSLTQPMSALVQLPSAQLQTRSITLQFNKSPPISCHPELSQH